MPLTVSHALSATTPDDPTYEIRPSHWNDTHALTVALVGSEVSGAFSNAGNVSFGLSANGFITASANVTAAPSPVNVSAGTASGNLQTIVFSNSNGVSFGLNGSTVTASHNGLTTAAQSNHSHGVTLNLTNLSGTTGGNSNGITLSLSAAAQSTQPVAFSAPGGSSAFSTLVFANSNGVSFSNSNGSVVASVATNYLTTAAQSNQVVNSLNGSTGQVSLNVGSSLSASTNGSSITFGLASNITTALQSAGAYLTTARASNDAVGLNTAATNVTWTVNSSGISLNAGAYLTTAAQSNHSHGNPTLALTNLSGTTASNSNGLTLSLSAAAPGGGGNFSAGVSNIGNTGGDTGVSGTRLVLVGSQNITLNQATDANGLTVSFSGGAGAAGNTGFISAGAATASLGTVVFSNSNGVSFGVNGQTVTASHNGLTQQSTQPVAASAANGSAAFSTLSFSNANGISFSTAAGPAIVASHNGLTSQSNQAFSASGGSSAFQTLNFANSNGITFTNTNGSVAASYTVPSVTQYFSATNTTFNGTNVSGSITLNTNGLRVDLSAAGAGAGSVNFSAGTTSGNLGSVVFSNSNGVSFGLNGSTITASVAQLSAGVTNAGNTSGDTGFVTGQFNLQGGNNITLSGSTNGASMSVTVSAPNYVVSNSAGSFTFRTLNFSNANNVTWGTSAGSIITASVGAGGGGGAAISAGANSQSTGTVNFANSNGITFGLSNNGTMTASHNGLTTAAQSDHSHGNPTLNLTNLSGTTASNSAGFTLSLSAAAGGGGVTPVASASNGSFSFTTLGFSNANNVTFGTSAGSIITASVAAPGAAAEQNAINLLGANTAGNTTATGSTIGMSGINLTLSGTNGSQVVFSAPATSSLVGVSGITLSSNGSTVSVYQAPIPVHGWGNYSDGEHLTVVNGQNTILFQPMFVPAHIAFSEVVFPINYTNASNSSNSCTLTMHVGIYTRNASSLSLFTSTSSSYATTNSGTAGAASLWLGKRNVPVGFTSSLTPGQYWLALRSQTTTGGGAGMSFSNYHFSNQNTVLSGRLGVASNASVQFMPGMGSYSATSTAMPGSVAFTQIRGSAAVNLRGVAYYFGGANV